MMQRYLPRAALFGFVAFGLSGCLSEELAAFAEGYEDEIETALTTPEELPTRGSARYVGHAGLDVENGDVGDLDGRLNMEIDFETAEVSGEITDLTGDEGVFAGTVFMNGELSDAALQGHLDGEIVARNNGERFGAVFNENSRFNGALRGEEGQGVIGDFEGTVEEYRSGGNVTYQQTTGLGGGFYGEVE